MTVFTLDFTHVYLFFILTFVSLLNPLFHLNVDVLWSHFFFVLHLNTTEGD